MTADRIVRLVWTNMVAPNATQKRKPTKEARPEWSYPGPELLKIVREAREEMIQSLKSRRRK